MRVAVLLGGVSDERDVSLSTGIAVTSALRAAGHDAVAVDTVRGVLSRQDEQRLLETGLGVDPPTEAELGALDPGHVGSLARSPELRDVDVFFVALHGGAGEDGTVQSLLESAGVAYTGSDRLGCSLAMDKEVSKRLFRDADLLTPEWLSGTRTVDEVETTLGLPVIVKVSSGGSSLRLRLAHDRAELADAITESRAWDDLVLFESYRPGRELTVGILGDEALPVGEIIPEHELFDYACKYQPGMAQEIFPADVSEELAEMLQSLALRAHRVLRLRDYSRVDFMVDREGRAWCLEANAAPGMTPNSLLPKAAQAAGISFPELCDRIAGLARMRHSTHSKE